MPLKLGGPDVWAAALAASPVGDELGVPQLDNATVAARPAAAPIHRLSLKACSMIIIPPAERQRYFGGAEPPKNSLLPSANVMLRPLARFEPSRA